jgi:hypothetical protein
VPSAASGEERANILLLACCYQQGSLAAPRQQIILRIPDDLEVVATWTSVAKFETSRNIVREVSCDMLVWL